MKTTVFGMMIAAMMMAGTTVANAKNNVRVTGNHTTVVVVDKCNHCKHIMEHRHVLDKRHMDCKVCHVKLDRFGRPLPGTHKHTNVAPAHTHAVQNTYHNTPAVGHNTPAPAPMGQQHFKK